MRASAVLRSVIYRALAAALAALAILSAIMPAPAFAADSDQQVKTVRVGWLVNNEGFQEGTPGERLSGWGYDYLQTLSYYTPGWQYEYVSGTFTELMDMLEAGEIDLLPNISYSEKRAQKLLFSSNPEGTERYYIYAKLDRDDLATGDPQALQGLTIGCNPGTMQTHVGQQWLANEGITCTYKEISTGSALFDALANGRGRRHHYERQHFVARCFPHVLRWFERLLFCRSQKPSRPDERHQRRHDGNHPRQPTL